MRVGILGGTGPAGTALAARLASCGCEVVIGSRSAERAQSTADEIIAAWPSRTLNLRGGDNDEAASQPLVIVATPWDAAASTAESVAEHLRDKVVITMANALTKVGNELQPLVPPRGSVSVMVQALLPSSKVAAAFQHLPAKELSSLDHEMDSDVLICSDHKSAIDATAELVRLVPGLRPLDAGTLSSASAIEAFTAVLIHLNMRYRTQSAIKITGARLPD